MGHEQGYYTIAQVNDLLADMQAQFDLRMAELQDEFDRLKPYINHPTVITYTSNTTSSSYPYLHLVRDAVGEDSEDEPEE